ncbi:phosphoribosylamine--glycine ligase [candidate division KSB1 bacterium]|nr:phosphoribosylamine--glycine ligase [candidate division KSB1 bacterium]NIR72436.1 phosphoribosylamine--glycine ligase [candidate division KSB1 bacterium]NIS23933.1 phosphoribosylamine--glycine ligase [candidate division KSB1 bacterium]NIT70850.1 phosphoribosylamine--glycine ligase [candidate division KSB1 bacterium]NIU24581.1 phosphoribosylamine--glycine ligase [candidate division KSB1 bacterium]
MRLLVIGGGGREHALVWKIRQSPLVETVYCAPGNPGIGQFAECVNIAGSDIEGLLEFARKNAIDLTVVGPEQPLVDGIVDEFEAQGLSIFGPTRKAAEIEGSKAFTKYLLDKYKIPTADCIVFDKFEEAKKYLLEVDYPTVIKADGLAAGKGTIVCQTEQEAQSALTQIMIEKAFGDAGSKVIVESFMAGEEASILALTDGENITYLPSAQDHKAIFDDDEGPNTGGMGAYAPAPVVDNNLFSKIREEVFEATIKAMALENRPYRGVLYAGLMITADGPKVVEFNCRFGDPEAQAILPLVKGDVVEFMFKIAKGKKIDKQIEIHKNRWALCVVIASGGYPESYEKGITIHGLEQQLDKDVIIFHAGTKKGEGGKIVTDGGRVLGVTAVANDFHKAREKSYWAVGKITFDKAYYRKDIGVKALEHLRR